MICLNCSHQNTQVTNSRAHKKAPQVWRRRTCTICHKVFSTYERPALYEELQIENQGRLSSFNSGRLFMSIIECLDNSKATQYDTTQWLVRSIEDALCKQFNPIIKIDELKEVTYFTINNFSRDAGLKYAAQHSMMNKIQRGRPAKPRGSVTS